MKRAFGLTSGSFMRLSVGVSKHELEQVLREFPSLDVCFVVLCCVLARKIRTSDNSWDRGGSDYIHMRGRTS